MLMHHDALHAPCSPGPVTHLDAPVLVALLSAVMVYFIMT